MNQGIRTLAYLSFACCVMLSACREATDPKQVTAVEQLISATDAAMLTLNELDRGRYVRTDSLYSTEGSLFHSRFHDTLDRSRAQLLGDQYVVLRAARTMGDDHDRMQANSVSAGERLRTLRNDLRSGAIDPQEAASLIAIEQRFHTSLMEGVHGSIDNYRLLQRTWERADSVAQYLAEQPARSNR